MKRPAFQFYPADWRSNAKLRRCSDAARGAWMDVLCLLHDADEYGVLRWPLADIAQASGVKPKLIRELVDKGVLKGADKDAPDYMWAPSHAGKKGAEVALVAADGGPVWYCSRFARDEYVRQRRGVSTRFEANPKGQPKPPPTPPFGERQGYGASSASSGKASEPNGSGADAPADPVWGSGLAFLLRKGIPEKPARGLLGQLRKAAGDVQTGAILADAESQDISDPAPWLMAAAAKARTERANGENHNATPRKLSAVERVRANCDAAERRDAEASAAGNVNPDLVAADG